MKKLIFLSLFFLSVTLVFGQGRETRSVGNFTKIAFRLPGKLYLKQGSPQKVELDGDKDVLKEIETDVEGTRLVIEKENDNWNWKNDGAKEIKVYVTVPNIEEVSVSGSGDVIGESKITTNDLELKVSGSGNLKLDIDASGDVEGDVSGSGDMELSGKCKSFESHVSGSGKVDMAMTIQQKADLSVSGSGEIKAKGSASDVEAGISGSGKILAADLQTNRCEVKISGSGDVEISVKEELDANISGSGKVRYKGDPAKVNSNASGSGKVSKM